MRPLHPGIEFGDRPKGKILAGVQLQACANEFSDIDVLGLSTRMADLEEEER